MTNFKRKINGNFHTKTKGVRDYFSDSLGGCLEKELNLAFELRDENIFDWEMFDRLIKNELHERF
jgi:hypothetical protein